MIDQSKMEHCYAYWFVGGADQDWLAVVYREKGTGKIITLYRFRYYTDGPSPFNDDEKHWYKGVTATAEKACAAMDYVAKLNAARYSSEVQKVEVNGDGDKAFKLLAQQPWAHLQPTQAAGEA